MTELMKELLELEERHRLIHRYIEQNTTFSKLSVRQQHLLVEQRIAMEAYATALAERIEAEENYWEMNGGR